MNWAASAQALVEGDRAALARALNLVEDSRPASQRQALDLLEALPRERLYGEAQLVGITGPPGVGKSTLVAALIDQWRAQSLRVGVLAVDPTSPISGGALLGDRLRMHRNGGDLAVFIRSLAGRGELGGLAAAVYPMSQLMLASCDRVIVETIGVGQTEIDIVGNSDTVCLIVQPASGDIVQFIKAGIVEVPALFVVNKADLGEVAGRTAGDLQAALRRPSAGQWAQPVVIASAKTCEGVGAVAEAIEAHREHLVAGALLRERREAGAAAWACKRLRVEFGEHGMGALGGEGALAGRFRAALGHGAGIFRGLQQARHELVMRWNGTPRASEDEEDGHGTGAL